MNTKIKGTLLALVGGAFWGCSGACGQFLFDHYNVTANWLVPIRLFVGGLVLMIVYTIKSPKQMVSVWRKPGNIAPLLIYGLLGIMLCQYSYFLTIQWSNAGTATVLQYLAPVMIMTVVCVTERKMPRLRELAALVLAVAGVFLIATHGNFSSLAISGKAVIGGLISAATVVVYNLAPRRLLNEYPAPVLLGWAMFIGGIVLALLLKPWTVHAELDFAGWTAVAAIIFLGSVAGFTLYMLAVKYVGATRASIFASIEPVTAEVLAVVWLGSPVYAADVVALIMIVSTVFILAVDEKKKA
ncbi:MAG: DMT family transporter [Clostridiales bacterium]|nr:DMT family transporter [Clostridiales bacterium]